MQATATDTAHVFKLNGERVTRNYTVEVTNTIEQGKKQEFTAVVQQCSLTYYGKNTESNLRYRIEIQQRFLLSKRYTIIKTLSKAQKIALSIARINDLLEVEVDVHFKWLRVTNTNYIREQWQRIKTELLDAYPDLNTMVTKFDQQLQEEHIQQLFQKDPCYNFIFANLFYHEFIGKEPIKEQKTISNALGGIPIPIVEYKKISKYDITFSNVTIAISGEMDTANDQFPVISLKAFAAEFLTNTHEQYEPDFRYQGTYRLRPEIGALEEGNLEYAFEIKDHYKKTTTITFNLEDDEQ